MARSSVYYMNTGPWPGYVGFTTDEDAYRREMRRLKINDPAPFTKSADGAATSFFNNHGTGSAIICIRPRRRTKEQYAALIAHEAVHIVQDMRERLGNLGSEAEAYLVQHIVQECLQIAWKTNRSIRKAPVP